MTGWHRGGTRSPWRCAPSTSSPAVPLPSGPQAWTPERYLLKGASRLPLDDAEREFLGERAAAFPALG
ncbi:MAG TPA: hypothetical protein VF838_14885 [Trebonia sp.]